VITENTLRTKIEVTADGQLKATLDGVAQSVEKIDKAQQAQADSANAAATAGQANATATQAVGESAAEAEARIRAMVQASLERQRAEQAQITASMRSVDATKVATQSIQEQVAAHQKAIAAADAYRERSAAASKAAGNTAGIDTQREAMHKLLGEIDPTITSLDKLDKQQAKLAGFKKAGLLSDDDFTRFSQAIDGSRNRITAAGEAMSHFSLNTAQSRRELGYLVKDLATGNFGRFNQSALTLANTSGLLTLAMSGVGVAVGGTAAALGLYVLAAIKGYQEDQELRRSIIATGNFAGVTAGTIRGMADDIGGVSGTSGQAQRALAALVDSGRVTRDRLKEVAQSAVDFSTVTGKSVEDGVKAFVSMQDDPVRAVKALDDQLHFLTATQYENIKALQEQGDMEAASAIAQTASSQALRERALEVQANVGLMERAWDNLRDHVRDTWDAMKHVGVTNTADDDLKSINDELKVFRDRVAEIRKRRGDTSPITDADLASAGEVAGSRDRINELLGKKQTAQYGSYFEDLMAGTQARDTQANDQLKRDSDFWDKQIAGAKSDRAKMMEIAAINDAASRDIALNPNNKAVYLQRQKAALADVEKRYAPKAGKAPDLSIDVPVPGLDKTIEGYQKGLDAQAKVTVGLQDYRQVQEAKLQTAQEAYDLQVASIGMSDREIAAERELIGIHREADADLQRLNKQRASMTKEQHDAQLSTIKEFENARVEAARTADERMLEAQGNWRHGMSAALKNYADSAADVAGHTKDLFANAFDGMGDALANFATTSKGDFSGLVDSIIKDLIRMESRILVSQVLQSVLGAFMGSYGAEGTNTFSSIGTDSSGGSINFVSQVGGRAAGGRITGPGTGTSDSILARVSTGENVITASATDYYGQSFMDALNAKQVPRFAEGGRVGGGGGAGMGGGMEVVVNITNQGQAVQAQQTGARMDGQKMIIDMVLQAVQSDIAKGGGTAQAMQQRFGLTRRGVPVGG
jgi:lambda family phage tail tape measure protein